ncbi:hypothetical protein HGM15179_000423 [Zosterops borbonicus]|uniref:Uncharacterized protein n=1 Tax=Zosterops borbonicus TaxID=364589 RepID=A0A8K1GXJ4_9PASS|nr:hypothetical protein HGM15179_000423 [Zosterops borbonicus]
MPGDSKTDMRLGKAGPIRNYGPSPTPAHGSVLPYFTLARSHQFSHGAGRSESLLVQAEKIQLYQPFLIAEGFHSPDHLLGPTLDLVQQVSVFPVMGAQSWMQHSRWGLTRVQQWDRIPSLDLLATLMLMQPRIQVAFWAGRALCLLMSSFSCIPGPSWQGCSGSVPPPACVDTGIALTQLQPLHLALLNLLGFPWVHYLSLSESFWMASCPSGLSAAPLGLVSSANLLRVHLIPLSMSLIKASNSTNPNMDS